MKNMTLHEYKKLLDKHDWYTFYSDDWKVRKQGEKEEEELLEMACVHGEKYQQAYIDKLEIIAKGEN